MPVPAITAADVDYVMDLDDEDLAALLVTAGAGTEYDDPGAEGAAGAIAKSAKSASALGGNWFRERARRMFERAWPKIKGVVCQAYKDRDDLQVGGKDWVKYLIGLILPIIGIGSGFAALLAMWAVRQGLDALCKVED